jgi:uncharacterized protein (DUF1501 family)
VTKILKREEKILLIENTIKLNSDFALHPRLSGFHEAWTENTGTIVHATSIPYTQRSHFEGQNLMESGGRIAYQEKTGWVGRAMKIANLKGDGLALSLPMPLLLRGVPKNNNYYPSMMVRLAKMMKPLDLVKIGLCMKDQKKNLITYDELH